MSPSPPAISRVMLRYRRLNNFFECVVIYSSHNVIFNKYINTLRNFLILSCVLIKYYIMYRIIINALTMIFVQYISPFLLLLSFPVTINDNLHKNFTQRTFCLLLCAENCYNSLPLHYGLSITALLCRSFLATLLSTPVLILSFFHVYDLFNSRYFVNSRRSCSFI